MFFRVPPAPRCASPFALLFPGDRSLITGVILSSVNYCSSGKEALLMLLRQIRERRNKRFVVVQAYTCPDIATAVVEAGFKLALCDVDYTTLRPRPETVTVSVEDTAAVILSNLYGMPDDVSAWRGFSEAGAIIVDDACQAALSKVHGVAVGERTGWGVYSFGRGKAISGVGGGAAFCPDNGRAACATQPFGVLSASDLRALFYWIGFSVFSHPCLYGITERLPFLNLGETVLHRSVPVRPITRVEIAAARAKLATIDREIEAMKRNAAEYARRILDSRLTQPFKADVREGYEAILLRYPVLAESGAERERLLSELAKQALSCPPGYPKALADYPELQGHFESGSLEESRRMAATLFTLPTHKGVSSAMISKMGL